MRSAVRPWLTALALAGLSGPLLAQTPPPPGVAAVVNGQPITEAAVQRGLKRVAPAEVAAARAEIIDVLTDNLLIDQHLMQLNVAVTTKEIDDQLQQLKDEITKAGKGRPEVTFENELKELNMTEAELRAVIACNIRWDKFTAGRTADKALQDYVAANKEVFDGTLVRARHLVIKPADAAPAAAEKVKADLLAVKQQVEKKAAEEAAKVPATADALTREQARTRALEDAFGAAAREKSECASKQQGGDVDYFPRVGSMVEPFARAAFALKPYQISDVVLTPSGYHLILVVDRKPGRDFQFEDIKGEVKAVYCERLREQLSAQLRPKATIVVHPAPKGAETPPASPVSLPKPTPKP